MVLAVGDVEHVALEGHALRIVEAGLGEGAVRLAGFAGAGDGDLFAVEIRNDDAVMRAVGDEQPLARGVGQHLAGEEQRTRAVLLQAR